MTPIKNDRGRFRSPHANGPKLKWLSGVFTAIRGPLSYVVTLSDHRVIRRHVDHLKIKVVPLHLWIQDLMTTGYSISTDTTVTPINAPVNTTGVRRSRRVWTLPNRYDLSSDGEM